MQSTIDFVLTLLFTEAVVHRVKGLQILSLLFIRQMRDRGFLLKRIRRNMILIWQLRLPYYTFTHVFFVARIQLVVLRRDVRVAFMMSARMICNLTTATDLIVSAETAVDGHCLLAGDAVSRAIISWGRRGCRLMRLADVMRVLLLCDIRISRISDACTAATAMTVVASVYRRYIELGLRMMLLMR